MIAGMSQPRQPAALDKFFEWETHSWVEVVGDVTTSDKAYFMPLETLRAYFAADDCQKMNKILTEVFATRYPPIDAEFILREHVAVFAILLGIGQGRFIEDFARYEELSDRRLPFDETHPPVGFPTPDDDPTFIQRFCEKQRMYCVPIFDAHMLHKHFGNGRLLPITSKEPHGGGASDQFVVTIYGPHNRMPSQQQETANNPYANTFLLKRYPTKGGEARYNQKISGFRSLRQADNVIKFYGSYIYRDSYNILLEFADKGSLEEYFRRESPPSRGEDIIKLWERLFQLIKGLKAIHSGQEGHFDVRPENILVVSKGAESADWLFKFADFGATNAKDRKLEGRLSKADEMKECSTYEAPECYLAYHSDEQSNGSSNSKVTWPADIWSLGCIYSEAAMWIADGFKGLAEYRKQRMADNDRFVFKGGDCFHDGERVLPCVIDTHKEIEDRLRRSDYITQDVLDSMVEEMLWEEDRPNAKALWRKAEGVLSRARQRLGANSGDDQLSRHSSGNRSLPPPRSKPPTKPLPVPPRPPPAGLSSIAEQVHNVEKWRSQVTGSVISSSQPARPPSDISSPALTHAQLSSAASVKTDLDREINGSLASWQIVDDNSQASPITPFTSPHGSTYEPSVNETPLPRHRILRPHPQFEYRRPPQAMSHMSNPRNTDYDNPYMITASGELQPQSPPPLTLPSPQIRMRNDGFNVGYAAPISTPPLPIQQNRSQPISAAPAPLQHNGYAQTSAPPTPLQLFNSGPLHPGGSGSDAPPLRKTENARIFSQEITTTFKTQADWDVGNAIIDPRTVSEKRTSLGRDPSQATSQATSQAISQATSQAPSQERRQSIGRAPSRAGSQQSTSVYSDHTSPSVQADSVSFTTMIRDEPKPPRKTSKRGFGFSVFAPKPVLVAHPNLAVSRPSTAHQDSNPAHSSSDTASMVSWAPEHGPGIEYLSLNTCLEWKRANKKIKKNQKLPPLPGAHRLKGLSDRDHVFIIDDSVSMGPVWPDVKRLFEALSYMVKGMSPDGTELFFTISYDTWRRKDTFDLCQYLEKKGTSLVATTEISKRLNIQLETYRARYTQEKTAKEKGIDRKKREKIAGVAPKVVRPMSFYILTNGEWRPGSNPKAIIQEHANWMIAQNLPAGQVTFEFISFANSGSAMQKMNDLAKMDFGVEIVDCTRWTGNVLKMLSGPLDKSFWSNQEGGENGVGEALGPVHTNTARSEISEMAA